MGGGCVCLSSLGDGYVCRCVTWMGGCICLCVFGCVSVCGYVYVCAGE